MSYGNCPVCGAPGVTRERRPNGNDECAHGHTYPSDSALPEERTVKAEGWTLSLILTPDGAGDGIQVDSPDGNHCVIRRVERAPDHHLLNMFFDLCKGLADPQDKRRGNSNYMKLPEGWEVDRHGDDIVIHTPRENGVRGSTTLFPNAPRAGLAEQLLYELLSQLPEDS